VIKPFPRLSYAEAIERYGSDKPDMRFGLEIKDLSDIAAGSEFSIFQSAVAEEGKVKGISAPGCSGYTRGQLEELNRLAKGLGAGGLVSISLDAGAGSLSALSMKEVKSVAAKFLTLEQVREMAHRLGAGPGDLLLIIAGRPQVVASALGALRQEVGLRLGLADPDLLAFAFVTGFPLLGWNQKSGRWEAEHHPFTAPQDEDIPLLDKAPEKAKGRHYDIICNGYEIGGGSIRIHVSELQRKVFSLMGYSDAEISELFGHMLEAFDYGAPPHGGIAIGIDRLVMLLAAETTIREVIAFPKTQEAIDLTFRAPSPVSEAQLKELHLRLREEE
jgi:aspartyl-tRNA synthetase